MDDSRFFTLDDSLWPFVMLQLRGKPTNEEYAEYLETMASYIQRQEPHLVVLDMLQARFSSTEQIHQQAAWIKKHEALLRQYSLGTGFLVGSSFIRLGMNVIFHIIPPISPYFVSTQLEAATAWGALRLEEAGQWECAQRVRQRYEPRASSRTG